MSVKEFDALHDDVAVAIKSEEHAGKTGRIVATNPDADKPYMVSIEHTGLGDLLEFFSADELEANLTLVIRERWAKMSYADGTAEIPLSDVQILAPSLASAIAIDGSDHPIAMFGTYHAQVSYSDHNVVRFS